MTTKSDSSPLDFILHYPEMHGPSDAPIQAEITHSGKYRIVSKDPLPDKFLVPDGRVSEFGSSNIPNRRAGWYRYYATNMGFYSICRKYNGVVMLALL